MANVLTRALIFSGIVVSVAGALILSSGASHTRIILQESVNNVGGEVVRGGNVIGQDPDINVRNKILRDYGNGDL